MHTNIHQVFAKSSKTEEAKDILGNCVHCGFCTATCPTYQELKDERDGPRGRIYLIKQFLETGSFTEKSRVHLDRCLTCRSCETTCPSGVKYGRLIDIARELSEQYLPRPKLQQLQRWCLAAVLSSGFLLSNLVSLGRLFKPVLPKIIQQKIPSKRIASPWPKTSHNRVVILLAGCAQSVTEPNTNAAAARVLDKLEISAIESEQAGCCGAVNYHLSQEQQALAKIRTNIDAWWPMIEAGAESIVITASGCGAMIQDYAQLLIADKQYHTKARRISEMSKDLSEVLNEEDLSLIKASKKRLGINSKIAVHCPCTLSNALGKTGAIEAVMQKLGVNLATTAQQPNCCGSAGTYSILQPALSQKLLTKKLQSLSIDSPSRIVTANIGCQLHLETAAQVPVDHWIELIDEILD